MSLACRNSKLTRALRPNRLREERILKIMVLGIRGMPNVQGGVETHAEQLYRRLAALGCEVEALVRTPFVPKGVQAFGPIQLHRLWSPRRAGLEALVHSVLGVLYAGLARPDILHIHSIGPAIVTPIARLLGLKVVVTYHSKNYEHEKWGPVARWILQAGERVGMTCSHARIAVSKAMRDLIQEKYNRDSVLIPNGVIPIEPLSEIDHVVRFGLKPGEYFLHVGRVAPEKRQMDLIDAYRALQPHNWQLALVGGLDKSSYSQAVQSNVGNGVVLTGFLNGAALAQLYSHAGGFVLPSSHEGMPIALLEALSYGLPVLASDIPANLDLDLDAGCYYRMGDIEVLADSMAQLARAPEDMAASEARRRWVVDRHDWDRIADQTLQVYRSIASASK